ncbi:hypothetical protein [Calothrix sp. 336/3]|uniref:hypothetical protein n=1 Tax=Calothrix sp. 336/3 TaxID=1337936 RepID=UPI0004E32FAE|nr:hypothetical protein [Calothrix sp. 336/3]AKG21782.1 hypothetical protein IJ00_11415 [Calothrix sp. 336/3]
MINNPGAILPESSDSGFIKCNNDEIAIPKNTPVTVLNGNGKRTYSAFINNSLSDITLVLEDKSKAAINKGIVLKPNGSFEITSINLYKGKVSVISAQNSRLSFVECSE